MGKWLCLLGFWGMALMPPVACSQEADPAESLVKLVEQVQAVRQERRQLLDDSLASCTP